MNTKSILIATFVSSIISVVLLYLEYKGYFRAWRYKNKSNQVTAEFYRQLPDYREKVSLFIMPNFKDNVDRRNADIESCINSLLDQTVKIHKFYILSEYKYNHTLSDRIKQVATIYPVSDIDHAYKQCLLQEKDCNAIHIYIYPHFIYGIDYLETVLDNHLSSKNNVSIDTSTSNMILNPGEIQKQNSIDDMYKNINVCSYNDNIKLN